MVLARDKKCQKCGSTDRLSIDHVIPRSRGGTNVPSNLTVLCVECNTNKAFYMEWDWFERIKMAFYVDEITERLRNDLKGMIMSLVGTVQADVRSLIGTVKADVRLDIKRETEELRKLVDGQAQVISFLSKKLSAIEARQKIKWVSEITSFEGYKKI